LFRRIGPPVVAPNWFCFRFGLGWPVVLRKKSFALKMSLRRNSHSAPWTAFSPRFVIKFVVGTIAPNIASFCDV
jgi:hypothetical protein